MKSLSYKSLLFLAAISAAGPTACNSADFKSKTDKKITPEAASLVCSEGTKYTEEDLRVGVRGEKNARLIVNGEFCPQAPSRLTILFLVDFSLSMYNEEKDRGNDPVVNGSCGRLDAAKAIVKSHKENITDDEAKITAGFVQFSSKIEDENEPASIDELDDVLTVKNFCGGTTGTNYKLAFEEATKLLKDIPGNKVVYLISDGMPTEGGGGDREIAPRHRDAAQKAADEMRDNVSLLTYNTVYLGSLADIEEDDFDPNKFLVDLTGSEKRVKVVEKASDLAEEILKLDRPVVDIDTKKVTAKLSADGFEGKDIDLTLFEAVSDKPETWRFATEEFDAFPGSDTTSRLQITAPDKNGETYLLTLKFEPGDETKPIDEP